jgi:hypothetical protein
MVLLFEPVFVTMSMTGSSLIRRTGEEFDAAACPRMLMEVLPTLPFTLISTISMLEPGAALEAAVLGVDPHATSNAETTARRAQLVARRCRPPARSTCSPRGTHWCVVCSLTQVARVP